MGSPRARDGHAVGAPGARNGPILGAGFATGPRAGSLRRPQGGQVDTAMEASSSVWPSPDPP
eukprot:11157458-Lingulodinium_polyedra.AAC.1